MDSTEGIRPITEYEIKLYEGEAEIGYQAIKEAHDKRTREWVEKELDLIDTVYPNMPKKIRETVGRCLNRWYEEIPRAYFRYDEETRVLKGEWFIEGCDIVVSITEDNLSVYAKQTDEHDISGWTNWEDSETGEATIQAVIDIYEAARRTYG